MIPYMRIRFFTGILTVLAALPVFASTDAPITLESGKIELFARGGMAQLDRDWTWIADGGLRIGLPNHFEIAFPAAVTYAFLHNSPLEISITTGVTDLWPVNTSHILFTPAIVIALKRHLSHEAAAFFALDYTHIQENTSRSPGFLRGAGAIMVDMGPYLSWCIGISYQRILIVRTNSEDLHRSGLAGQQRVSIGSVRATPFTDTPLFTIHTLTALDFTIHARLDIDSGIGTTDARFEGGLLAEW